MADTPDTILLVRLQGTGDNVNLWGGYLNTALQTMTRGQRGYQAYAMSDADATISWTNYSATNDLAAAKVKLTGTLTAARALTGPNYFQKLTVWNATSGGYAVTIKVSGQTGISIPNGSVVELSCDGTDYRLDVSTDIIGATATLNNTSSIVTKIALDAAVAASFTTVAGAGGVIKITSSDTTPNYLSSKVVVSGPIAAAVTTPGGDEDLTLTVQYGALLNGGTYTANAVGVINTKYLVNCDGQNVTLNLGGMASPTVGGIIELHKYGTGTLQYDLSPLKMNGSTTTITTAAEGISRIVYTGSSRGFVEG